MGYTTNNNTKKQKLIFHVRLLSTELPGSVIIEKNHN